MKDKEAEKSEKILLRIKTGNRETWANEVVKDLAFLNSAMWEDSIARAAHKDNKPTPTVNEMKPARDQVVGMLVSNPPRFNAIGREDSDARSASHVADLFSYIWYNSKGNAKMRVSCGDFEDVGMGALLAYVDPSADRNKGEIFVTDINPLDIYISNSKDPDTQDAIHKLIVKTLNKEEVLLLAPNFDFKDAQQKQTDDIPTSGNEAKENQIFETDNNGYEEGEQKYEYIDRYTKVKHKIYHVEDLEGVLEKTFETKDEYISWSRNYAVIVTKVGAPVRYIVREQDVQEAIGMVQQLGNVFHYIEDQMTGELIPVPGVEGVYPGTIPNSTTEFTITTMADLTHKGGLKTATPLVTRIQRVSTIGGKVIYNEILPISRHPLVTFMLHHNRNPYPYGDARLTRPYQEEINKIDQLIIVYNTNISALNLLVPKGGKLKDQILKEGGKSGLKVFEYDTDTDAVPIVIQYPPLPNSLFELRQTLIAQIQRIYGAYPFQEGNIAVAPDSGKNTMILDEMGSRRSNSKRATIEDSINELGKVILEMIPFVYNRRKVLRIIEPNHESRVTVINDQKEVNGGVEILNDVSVGEVDIIVESGSMLPSNRMGEFDMLERAFQSGIIRNPSPVIKKMNLSNIDQILRDEDALRQAQQAIAQLEETVKNLQGDLQTAQRNEVESEKKVAVQKTLTKLNSMVNKVDAESRVAVEKFKSENKPKTPKKKV